MSKLISPMAVLALCSCSQGGLLDGGAFDAGALDQGSPGDTGPVADGSAPDSGHDISYIFELLPEAAPGFDSAALAVNAAGSVVGWTNTDAELECLHGFADLDYRPCRTAVVWTSTSARLIPPQPGHSESIANDIDDSGRVVGTTEVHDISTTQRVLDSYATLSDGRGTFVLPELEPQAAPGTSVAHAINSGGTIVGISRVFTAGPLGSVARGVRWSASATDTVSLIELSAELEAAWPVNPVYAARAFDINESGQVAGLGFVLRRQNTPIGTNDQGRWIQLDDGPSTAGHQRQAQAVGASGIVGGWDNFGRGEGQAAVWHPSSSGPWPATAMATDADFIASAVEAINAADDIVFNGYDGQGLRGRVWLAETASTLDLAAAARASGATEVQSIQVADINDRGDLVGTAELQSGASRAFIMRRR